MAVIPITSLTAEGVALAAAIPATGADLIENNDGLLVVELQNPTGGALVCQFVATYTIGGMMLPNRSVTVPAGATRWVRPLPPAFFNDAGGDVAVEAQVGLLLRGLRF